MRKTSGELLVKRLLRKLRLGVVFVVAAVVAMYLILSGGLWVAGRVATQEQAQPGAIEARSTEPNSMRLIDNGLASLYARLRLIESAKKTIELEFFIFDIDQASRLISQALVRRASEGVKVRLLVDFSAPVFQLKPAYAHFMKEHGIEVRYYNTSSIYRIVSSQHRSHRKLLIIDGVSLITGGRNIADEYFDLGVTYNFLDSDVEVHGPIATAALTSFDLYWNSSFATASEQLARDVATKELLKVQSFLETGAADAAALKRVNGGGAEAYTHHPDRVCNDLTFVTDLPGRGESSRKVFSAIAKTLDEARQTVLAESPYFIIKEGGLEVLRHLRDRNVNLTVLTNSLFSTDATYAASALYLRERSLAQSGLSLYAFRGGSVAGQSSHDDGRWGTHAKRAVIDDQTVMIGTYNIDSELVLVCRGSRELASDMRSSIEARVSQAIPLIERGTLNPETSVLDGTDWQTRLEFAILLPLAQLFDFLL